ncbi:hypothetical protein [Paenarthrobacter sp. YJN-5]|uniref:hypothetical protein n=1 Tax=Paenarthrobacter sp. YJN-5 TaxID=2735316 RepID=UPI001877861A|nr:hypothetical protein [Paenarthrobacter sp. YJN-5]QOT19537.1 hypothetical protein HMI59_23185 [Paenarthrobacter sp. YJN-5]
MSITARHPRGTRSGGRFAPDVRTEPSLTLSPGMASAEVYRRYTENEMTKAEQRDMSRRLVRGAYDSKVLHKMAGTANINEAGDVLAAAQDDEKLDAAIHAVVTNEQRNPGTVHPDSIGFQLCRQLLNAQRATKRPA